MDPYVAYFMEILIKINQGSTLHLSFWVKSSAAQLVVLPAATDIATRTSFWGFFFEEALTVVSISLRFSPIFAFISSAQLSRWKSGKRHPAACDGFGHKVL